MTILPKESNEEIICRNGDDESVIAIDYDDDYDMYNNNIYILDQKKIILNHKLSYMMKSSHKLNNQSYHHYYHYLIQLLIQ